MFNFILLYNFILKRTIQQNINIKGEIFHFIQLIILINCLNSKFLFKRFYSKTPDDDVFRHLALTYSKSHKTMHLGISSYAFFINYKNNIIHLNLIFMKGNFCNDNFKVVKNLIGTKSCWQ